MPRRKHRSGSDNPMWAALARREAEKRALPFDVEVALTLYGGGDWDDAARALVDEHGVEFSAAQRWLADNRGEVEALVEAMQICIRRPEDVARCWEEALRRRGLWNEKTAKRIPMPPKKDDSEESS